MADEPLQRIVGHLRQAHELSPADGCTDAVLLARWIADGDQAAFAELVRRHAPMVLGVCWRLLHDEHEAEDAMQATFLVFARKAGSVVRRQALAGWLYRVAYRTALYSQRRRARRPLSDQATVQALPARPDDGPSWQELAPILDAEIGRLPEKLRVPFVLCHLEGRTNAEAARELGCPVGTILSRLARARERLRKNLARRGVTLTAALAAACAWADAAPVRSFVDRLTSRSIAAPTPSTVQLAEGIMRTMLLEKVRRTAVAILVLLLVGGTSAGWTLFPTDAVQQRAAPHEPGAPPQKALVAVPPQAAAAAQVNDATMPMEKKMLEAARKVYEMDLARYRNAQLVDPERLGHWSRRWLDAQLELATGKDDRLTAYREHLDRMRALERIAKSYAAAGQGLAADAIAAEYGRIQAELWLEQAKAKGK